MAHAEPTWKRTGELAGSPGVRRVVVLGSTGSIGTQTLDVIDHLNALRQEGRQPVRYEVVGLAAGRNAERLCEQARRLGSPKVALADLEADCELDAIRGPDAAERLVRETECDLVLAAMVGAAGLPATLAAVELGRDVALANKETLVAAGDLVVPAARRSGAHLLPVDSEHAAVWQALAASTSISAAFRRPPCDTPADVAMVTLTASGGPFRTWDAERIRTATPEQALEHPTWSMGAKVTVDSASLTNKALELIEAHHLFGLPAEKLDAVVHPQSIVHALIAFTDGSIIAQLDEPDMRGPIQRALTFPRREPASTRPLDLAALGALTFEPPDLDRFPALALGRAAIERGGTAGAVFNAANEAAVGLFLDRKIAFGRIAELTAEAFDEIPASPLTGLDDALEADAEARDFVLSRV